MSVGDLLSLHRWIRARLGPENLQQMILSDDDTIRTIYGQEALALWDLWYAMNVELSLRMDQHYDDGRDQ